MHMAPAESNPTTVSWAAVADGNGLRLNLRRIHRQYRLVFDFRVNDSGVQRDSQRVTRLQNGKMRRTADRNLPTLDELDARAAGFDADVAAAAKHGDDLAVHGVHAHRTGNRDGFAFDDPHGVAGRRIVGTRGALFNASETKPGRHERIAGATPRISICKLRRQRGAP